MELLILFALMVGVTIVPVMIVAKMVNARHTGFGPALLAAILLAAMNNVLRGLALSEGLTFLLVLAAGAAILAFILGTSLLRGLGASVIAVLVQIGMLVVLVYMGLWAAS